MKPFSFGNYLQHLEEELFFDLEDSFAASALRDDDLQDFALSLLASEFEQLEELEHPLQAFSFFLPNIHTSNFSRIKPC